MIKPDDIRPETLIAVLADSDRRSELRAALDAEQGSTLPLHRAYSWSASKAHATAPQLDGVARALMAAGADELLDDLVFHPAMPVEVLIELCDSRRCLSALGHRAGPRALLLRMAERHGYAEAILSLALDLYQDAATPTPEFAAFAQRHAGHQWMLRALAQSQASSRSKEAVYEDLLLGQEIPCGHHAVFVATCGGRTVQDLAVLLDRFQSPFVLVQLLAADLADPAKRQLVEQRAAAWPEVAGALEKHRRRQQAASAELAESLARELFALQDPKILWELAGNPRTPRDLLDTIASKRDTEHTQKLRGRARATIRKLR